MPVSLLKALFDFDWRVLAVLALALAVLVDLVSGSGPLESESGSRVLESAPLVSESVPR